MKKLSILFILFVAVVSWNCADKDHTHDNDKKHSGHGGCCCCGGGGGGQGGGNGSTSTLGWRGFGQPTTSVITSATGEIPGASEAIQITITPSPGYNGGWSYAQP